MPKWYQLTARDLRTVYYIIEGYPRTWIAQKEEVDMSAIQSRVKNLRDRCGANTNEHLIVILIKRGLIDVGEIRGYTKNILGVD